MKDAGYEHAHSSPIKTPQQLAVVIVLAFAVPVIGIILLTQFIVSEQKVDPATLAPQAVAARIQPVARVEFADAPAGPRVAKTGEEIYKQTCSACHAQGVGGAPKTGDKAAWTPLIKEGLDDLVKTAIAGKQSPKGVMPPRGGSTDLSDYEVARAVVYLANQAGANFREPPPPKEAAPAPKPVAAAATPGPAPTPVAAAPAAAPAAAGGANAGELLQKFGCLACHAADKKVIGPSYKEVAAKYAADKNAASALVKKVKAGGQGVWGQVPMPPNPQVSDGDLQAMVKFILTQK
jgi:cytochrome c5